MIEKELIEKLKKYEEVVDEKNKRIAELEAKISERSKMIEKEPWEDLEKSNLRSVFSDGSFFSCSKGMRKKIYEVIEKRYYCSDNKQKDIYELINLVADAVLCLQDVIEETRKSDPFDSDLCRVKGHFKHILETLLARKEIRGE